MTKRRSTVLDHRRTDTRASRSEPLRGAQTGHQPNRLEATADTTVAAVCIVAVVLLPLYFTFLDSSGPESDKAVLLIALAAVAAGAWLIGAFERARRGAQPWSANPLIWLGIALFGIYALATLLSIHARASLFGSLARHQGLLTHAAYAVFFVCAATRFRRQDQMSRLVSVLIFASIPAVVYGLAQQLGFDPAPTGGDPATVQWPVRSSMGQHLFFGAYLVLIIPLTAARLFSEWERRETPPAPASGREPLLVLIITAFTCASFLGVLAIAYHINAVSALLPAILAGYALLALLVDGLPDSTPMRRVRIWGYAGILAAQILALLFTSARGPWLGFFVSAAVFGILLAWWLGRRDVSLAILGTASVLALAVVVLNIPAGPLQPLRSVHLLHRISHLSESGGNDSSARGRWLIWQGVADLMTHTPAIGNTWGGPGRDIVGYGPEALDQAFEAVFPLKLRQMTSEVYTWDRAHDIYLDTLVDVGLLGLLVLLATVAVFFGRTWRDLIRRRGLPGWLCIGMISAIAGHMVEGIFGLDTAVTLLLFWLIIGFAAS
ncbi:MAG TPA: O-antigen ligase family protein, partial [Chloroflexota bacterium]